MIQSPTTLGLGLNKHNPIHYDLVTHYIGTVTQHNPIHYDSVTHYIGTGTQQTQSWANSQQRLGILSWDNNIFMG